jgi:hypothetical protein
VSDLPFVDDYSTTIAAAPATVWPVLRRYADRSLRLTAPLGWLLGTEPRSGFAVAAETPERQLVLTGRHRFSTYRLVFNLTAAPSGATTLAAQTYAIFPGPASAIYRRLVIGTPGHRIAVRRMLSAVAKLSTQDS